jgi:hypothetical protein
MGLPRHARSALRTVKDQKRPADPIRTAQQSPKKSAADVGGSPSAAAIPLGHDTHCVHAEVLMQLRRQLTAARRENSELTAALRKLLQQIQGLNAVLDAYTVNDGRPPRTVNSRPARGDGGSPGGAVRPTAPPGIRPVRDPRAPQFPFESTPTQRNP